MSDAEGRTAWVLLAGFVEGSDAALDATYFATLASRLAALDWPSDPPEPATFPDVGLGIRLPRPQSPSNRAIERAALDAATVLIRELVAATEASDATVAVEYDGEVIGWIERGRADAGVEIGLLHAWRQALDK